jgi:hypothetical protein
MYGTWVEVIGEAPTDGEIYGRRGSDSSWQLVSGVGGSVAWIDITGKPSTFPPDAHTHTASEVTDFAEAVDDRVGSLLVAGSNITLDYNDAANTLTVASTASGGVEEALNDGNIYARQNEAWTEIPGIGGLSPTEYNLNTAAYVPPPNTNNMRLNNANQTLATVMYLHHTNAQNVDISNALRLLEAGNKLLLQDKTNAAKYQMYEISAAITDFTTYTQVPVTWLSGGSPCTAGRVLLAAFGIGSSAGVGEAPIDGQEYVRKDGAWVVSSGGSGTGTVTIVNTGSFF